MGNEECEQQGMEMGSRNGEWETELKMDSMNGKREMGMGNEK